MFWRLHLAALFTSLVLALWTLAAPASAMPAGLCDDRGASAIAPAPELEASGEAIQRARTPASCPGRELPIHATVAPATRGLAFASVDDGSALPIGTCSLVAPPCDALEASPAANRPQRGVHGRVERPPRG